MACFSVGEAVPDGCCLSVNQFLVLREAAASLSSTGHRRRVTLQTMDSDPRAELQRLIDGLPEAVVPAVLRMVARLAAQRDPFLTHVLEAEEDDEELNEVGLRMLDEAREDSAAGRTHTLEEVERELGL